MTTPTYDLLDSVTLASSASSVTFSSIDQSYGDLVLTIEASGAGAGGCLLRLNSDTGNNYYNVIMGGNGSSASSLTSTVSYLRATGYASLGTDKISMTWQFFDYAVTDKHKSALCRFNRPGTGTSATASRWAQTAAINSVQVLASGTTFNAGSTFYLYGIAK